MIGMVCDQKIFRDLIKYFKPTLSKKLDDCQLDSSVFTI